SRAFAFTDIDGDGNMDVVLRSRLGPQVRVFQNICGAARKAIVLSLRGTTSNRDAIGARVEVDGQLKWVAAGSACLSHHTKRLHFGLGDAERAEKVRVFWPSGDVQELGPLDAGFLYEITEGSANFGLAASNTRRTIAMLVRVSVLLLVVLNLSAQNRPIGHGVNFYSKEKEAALGAKIAEHVREQVTIVESVAVREYIEGLGRRLAGHMPGEGYDYTFTVYSRDTRWVRNPTHEPRSIIGG
ncbi:MAG: hypothetical protein GY953_07685, partial [bacterium]|nr:hypothetical protein [bacterium]